MPNPGPRGLALLMDGPADALHVEVYTPAMNRARSFDMTPILRKGWNQVALAPGWSTGLPGGLYFVKAQPSRRGVPGFPAAPAPMWLLP
jgi:hypothetical protein